MISGDFSARLNAFTQELGFQGVAWEPRETTQLVTQTYKRETAEKVAKKMAEILRVGADNSILGIVQSRTSSDYRVIISNVSDFAKKLDLYEIIQRKVLPEHVKETQSLLARLCQGGWSGEKWTIGCLLRKRIPLIDCCSFIKINPTANEGEYLLRASSTYSPPNQSIWREVTLSEGDIQFILEIFKNHSFK